MADQKKYTADEVLSRVFDEDNDELKTDAAGGGGGDATAAKQDTGNTSLAAIDTNAGAQADAAVAAGAVGSLSAKLRRISTDIASLLTQTDGVEASLTSIDTKLVAGPSTAAKQDTGNTSLAALEAALYSGIGDVKLVKCSPTAFDGGTANARGDSGGTSDPLTLFTVTGDVLAAVYAVCTVDLAGTGSVSVGPAGNAALMLPATLGTDLDANEVWMDATPAIGKTIDGLTFYVLGNGVDIVEDVTTADITAGNIYYICLWKALSAGSTVVSAI